MLRLYPKYYILYAITALPIALFAGIWFALREEYLSAVVLILLISFLLSMIWNLIASAKYNRLIQKTLSEECDGEAFVSEHGKLKLERCKGKTFHLTILLNSAIAAEERGDLREALLFSESAADISMGMKGGNASLLRIVAYANSASYNCKSGNAARAEEYLEKLRLLRNEIKPNYPAAWLQTLEKRLTALSFDLRVLGGDYGDEVLQYAESALKSADNNRLRVTVQYDIGCIREARGERAEAILAYRSVIKNGNTLRVVMLAKERLTALDADHE